jgi:hypothetical protein
MASTCLVEGEGAAPAMAACAQLRCRWPWQPLTRITPPRPAPHLLSCPMPAPPRLASLSRAAAADGEKAQECSPTFLKMLQHFVKC